MKNYNHALLVMEKHDYPAEAREAIIRAEKKILNNEQANKIYESMYRAYWLKKKNFGDFRDKTKALAELIGEPEYTVYFILVLNCTKPLLAEYKKRGYPEEIYWDTVLDLKAKLLECKENHNIWGTFVEGWFIGFFKLERFGIGRLQFQYADFCTNLYEDNGVVIKDSEFVVGMHIPSHIGPLTYEARLDSYKRAHEFFRDKFPGKYSYFTCSSWLLYPDNLNILPENSNVSDFILDFEPLDITRTYDFGDAWRVFGPDWNKPVAELPRKTTMQRAFAEWFEQGKKVGHAYSLIIFDGEKLLTRCDRETYRKKYGY